MRFNTLANLIVLNIHRYEYSSETQLAKPTERFAEAIRKKDLYAVFEYRQSTENPETNQNENVL